MTKQAFCWILVGWCCLTASVSRGTRAHRSPPAFATASQPIVEAALKPAIPDGYRIEDERIGHGQMATYIKHGPLPSQVGGPPLLRGDRPLDTRSRIAPMAVLAAAFVVLGILIRRRKLRSGVIAAAVFAGLLVMHPRIAQTASAPRSASAASAFRKINAAWNTIRGARIKVRIVTHYFRSPELDDQKQLQIDRRKTLANVPSKLTAEQRDKFGAQAWQLALEGMADSRNVLECTYTFTYAKKAHSPKELRIDENFVTRPPGTAQRVTNLFDGVNTYQIIDEMKNAVVKPGNQLARRTDVEELCFMGRPLSSLLDMARTRVIPAAGGQLVLKSRLWQQDVRITIDPRRGGLITHYERGLSNADYHIVASVVSSQKVGALWLPRRVVMDSYIRTQLYGMRHHSHVEYSVLSASVQSANGGR